MATIQLYLGSALVNVVGAASAVYSGSTLVWSSGSTPVDTSLISSYNFDQTTGSFLDQSPNGRDVASATSIHSTTAKNGAGSAAGGTTLAGGSSTVNVSAYNTSGSRTVAFWAYRGGAGTWLARWQVQSADTGAFGVYEITGTLRARFRKGGTNFNADAGVAAPGSTWQHYAVTYDATTGAGILYINGTQAATVTVTGGGALDAADFVDLGTDGQSAGTSANAIITDDFRFYSRVLSASEITALAS